MMWSESLLENRLILRHSWLRVLNLRAICSYRVDARAKDQHEHGVGEEQNVGTDCRRFRLNKIHRIFIAIRQPEIDGRVRMLRTIVRFIRLWWHWYVERCGLSEVC